MASSSSSSPAPAFSSRSLNYDVFLSFREEDTRKTFVDHLYSALLLQGIHTYKEDKTLPRGESIGPFLMRVIDESRIAAIIFSKSYTDSSRCLDELTHIMKCKNTMGKIMIPIFYDVDQSEVLKQKRKYGETFADHEMDNKNKVEYWRKALLDATKLSGWDPMNIAKGHESKIIKEIVEKISSRLKLVTTSANEKLIRMGARVQRLKSVLQLGSGGVRMIGIWGFAGGGKTTLASSTYDEIYGKFDGSCFIANIREESSRHGLKYLQQQILLEIKVRTIGEVGCLMNKKLRNRKVLIVLDDVDHLDQLEALAGSPDWFGEGSRILITTRYEHLLKAYKLVVHNINLLHEDEAIELFQKHAFRGYIPIKDYEQLSKKVVSYAGRLPLVLIVLGSSLFEKNIHQWRSTLARLKEIQDNKILEKLKLSFDGLTKVQKDLFLDIACFFKRVDKDLAMERLDASGFHPAIGVEELRQKALITISEGKFDMHDLVQEMGHQIVRGEHPKNPEKHSRVWKNEDVLRICAMDAMTELDDIEAIHSNSYNLHIVTNHYHRFQVHEETPPPIVANMRNLRYINWKGDLSNPLINNFPSRELRCLILLGGIVDQLWNGYKYLPNLKMVELYNLDNLIMTPSFEGLPNLEKFKVYNCEKLEEIHSSFGGLDRLVSLIIENCRGIKIFPSITRLKKLETISFSNCPRLSELSEIQQKLDNLGDEDINPAVWEISNLNNIRLCFSRKYLRKLDLSWCGLGDVDMNSAVWELPSLHELVLCGNRFSRLNFSLMRIPRLKLLDVTYCQDLVKLSNLPSSIAVFNADFCKSLITFGDISNCKWLWKVSLRSVMRVGPLDGKMLLDSMLKGNAIEDHCISVTLGRGIAKGFVGRLFVGDTFTRRLPPDWYNDFCGVLIHVVNGGHIVLEVNIIIKQEVDVDSRFVLRQVSNEVLGPNYGGMTTYVGYLSFNSLRRTTCLSSDYNVISISVCHPWLSSADWIGAALVPWKSTDDAMQTTNVTKNCSEIWYEDPRYRPTFNIERNSKPSIKIKWSLVNRDI